jgi:hypothetical protein
VTALHEHRNAGWCHADAKFLSLDLFGYADPHLVGRSILSRSLKINVARSHDERDALRSERSRHYVCDATVKFRFVVERAAHS